VLDIWVQAMTKSEFLKQYKGMLVGAVGVFIVFTFRNPVMFGVGFFPLIFLYFKG
jgi:hypothetical protein